MYLPLTGAVAAMEPDTREALLLLGRRRTFAAGATLMRQGELGDSMVLVASGVVEILASDVDGRTAFLTFRSAGCLVGEFAVLGDRPRCATVVAVTPGAARVFEARQAREFLRRHPDAAEVITRFVVDKSREGVERRLRYAVGEPEERIARVLADHAARFGRADPAGTVIDVALNYRRIADLMHGSVSSVEKHLRAWSRAGVLETAYRGTRRLRILDDVVLNRVAAGERPAG